MGVDFMNKFIKIVLVATAKIDEGLHGLIRIGRNVLPLRSVEDCEGIVGEESKVGDAAVNVGGFVHADEGLIKDGKEIAKELQRHRLKLLSFGALNAEVETLPPR